MKKTSLFLLVISLLCIPALSRAGWVIVTKVKGSDAKEKQETLYIQGNIMKSVTDFTIIYDMNTSEFAMLMDSSKTYWKGTTKDYKDGIVEMMKARIAEELKALPENQRPYAERMYNDALDKFISGVGNDTVKVKTEVKKMNEKLTIATYTAQKYEVWVNNIKKVDMWISEKINIAPDFNYAAFVKFMKELTNSRSDLAYQTSPEYIAILNKGFSLKSFDADNSITRETLSVEKKQLDNTVFDIPQGYRKVTLNEILLLQNKKQ